MRRFLLTVDGGWCRGLGLVLAGAIGLSSCATVPPSVQPQVNTLVVAERFPQALKVLEDGEKAYGKNNELLYKLDQGLVLHLAGRYAESITVFEQAKRLYDELYTRSLTRISGSWLWNDYALPYRGEDFERVLVNIFQAVNFAALGQWDEALVEARDVDRVLTAINDQYGASQKNAYREDAFARLLSGLLYETAGGRQNLNDALIDYRKALTAYDQDYQPRYGVEAPLVLKQNLLATAQYFQDDDAAVLRRRWPDLKFPAMADKGRRATIYLIHYSGLSPVKVQDSVVLPVPDGSLVKMAFPKYEPRYNAYEPARGTLTARETGGPAIFVEESQTGEDIAGLAVQNLADRRLRVMAKAVLRPLGKYLAERAAERKVEDRAGRTSAGFFQLGAGLYNLFSEQADLRCWQTLPAQIRIARLVLDPGDYQLSFGDRDLGAVSLQAGETKFYVVRTSY